MFSDEILEQIFSDERARCIPICYQGTMIHVVEDVLERCLSLDEKEILKQTELLRKENEKCFRNQ